jgi:CRISPR system Cascade subunit CasD
MEAPTKSGILGLICCAEGKSRQQARDRLKDLKKLKMGVRVDRHGTRWWDYHTVGAKLGVLKADGKGIKRTATTHEIETLITRREYLCDASFLVALQGEPNLIDELEAAIKAPKWTLYLGRKCCPPSRPLLEKPPTRDFCNLRSALKSVPWCPRFNGDTAPLTLDCLLDLESNDNGSVAPDDALVWYDVPVSFDPPAHEARLVIRKELRVGLDVEARANQPTQNPTPAPPRPRADYSNTEYKNRRKERLDEDNHLCVFCKSPATTVQHVTYRHAGGGEHIEELRSLCRLCHDAVTMIEYGLGMGLDRINPEEPRWRSLIIQKRTEIIQFRSLETRRRCLVAEEVE